MKPEEALTWRGDGGANVTKRKSDHPQTEMEITPETREPLEEFTQEEIDSGVIATGRPPVQGTVEGIEKGLFEDLKESIREAGAILRDEREAARRTRLGDVGDAAREDRRRAGSADSDEADL